jgi:hypothetical protein
MIVSFSRAVCPIHEAIQSPQRLPSGLSLWHSTYSPVTDKKDRLLQWLLSG